jgi:hypothetical protein
MAEHDGFLGRWSQRKAMARQGLAPDTPAPAEPQAPVPQAALASAPPSAAAEPAPPAPLTLDDVAALTPHDDFSPFVTRSVAPEVRNAAMKKLFADPAFNVMDGLDIYIDDYSRPDPLPASLARRLLQAQWPAVAETPAAPTQPVAELGRRAVDAMPEPGSEPADLPEVTPASALPQNDVPTGTHRFPSHMVDEATPPVPAEPKP